MNRKGLKAVHVIPGMIFGGENNQFVPLIVKLLKERKLFYVSGGEKNAPLTYIDDLCEIIYQVVRISPFKGEEYFAFNTDMGIQKFIEQIAIFYKLPLPKRKYSNLS